MRIFVLLYFNLHDDLIKDRDGDIFVLRRRDDQRVVIGIIFRFPFEYDKALDTKSRRDGLDPSGWAKFTFVWMGVTRTWRQRLRDHF